MQEKKASSRSILRVLTAYKKQIIVSVCLGIALSLGAVVLASQVTDQTADSPSLVLEKQVTEVRDVDHDPYSLLGELDAELFAEPAAKFKDGRFTVLLVGLDRRPGDPSLSNTDTLLLVRVDILKQRVAILSIPRDTRVEMPGQGKDKINMAARKGEGIKTTVALVEELVGQRLDGYVVTDFQGFESIIDTLGGITLTVEKDMYYDSGDPSDGIIDLKKGTQRLKGSQALHYARFRQDALADIARTERQQAVMMAIGKECLQVKTIPKLPWLIPQIAKSIDTNFSLRELWSMTKVLMQMDNLEMVSQTLPGDFLEEAEISYWEVNPEQVRVDVQKFFEEGKTSSTFAE